MATFKILNLLAAITLALVACSLSATPVNALSAENGHVVRHFRHHNAILKKKRNPTNSRRCRPRESTPNSPAPLPTPETPPPPPPPPPATPPSNDQPNNNDGNNGGGGNNTGDNSNNGINQPAPAPPPSPSPAPPPPSPPLAGGNGRKGGLAWPQDDDNALRHMAGPNIGVVYNWSPYCVPVLAELGLDCASMLWGEKQIEEFYRLVTPGYARYILGFNEPNQHDQSNLNPEYAAQLWQQHIQPLAAQGFQLITPACTNAPDAIDWYRRFFAACNGCTFNALATHIYTTSAQELIDHLTLYHNTFNMDIWLTEFACQDFSGQNAQCSMDQVWSFMQTARGFMDSTPWVKQYFAFGAMYDMYNVNYNNQLLGGDGYPTPLGYYYIN